jgi:hypothetical protein
MNLAETWAAWRAAVTNPNESFALAQQENPRATMGVALWWMVLAGLATGLVALLTLAIMAPLMQMQFDLVFRSMPGDRPAAEFAEMQALMETFFRTWLVPLSGGLALLNVLFTPLFFWLGAGVKYLLGRMLGGQGLFGRYCYLTAAYEAPLTIAGALISLIPFVGTAALALSLYQLVLAYYVAKVELRLSQWRAVAVVLLPIAIVLFLFLCAFVSFLALIVTAGSV